MDNVKFDLRVFREDILRLSQLELAKLLGIRQDNVSRMEKNPEQISYPVIVKLAKLSGMTLDQVIGYEQPAPKALEIERIWDIGYYISALRMQINEFIMAHERLSPVNRLRLGKMDDFVKNVQKPKVGIAGEFASGKSTLMNNLLGKKIVPANASFFVSFRIHVKHQEDKPGYMNHDVYIMRQSGSDEIWNEGKLEDEAYCRNWILDEGGLDKISVYSGGGCAECNIPEIEFALVFCDSEILRNCDIIRLPYHGFEFLQGQGRFDRAYAALDILIYLMPIGSALGSSKIQHLKAAIRQLRVIEGKERSDIACLSNLFIVASKAHLMGTLEEAKKALDILGSRLYDGLPAFCWQERQAVSGLVYQPEDFYARIFSYAVDEPEWRAGFEKELCGTLKNMAGLARDEAFNAMRAYRDVICSELSAEIGSEWEIINKRAECQQRVRRLMETESVRWANNAQRRDRMIDAGQRCKKNSRDELRRLYDEILSEQNVTHYLTDTTGRCGQAQMQKLASALNSELEMALQNVLEKGISCFCLELDEYLAGFAAGIGDSGFSVYNEFAYSLQGKVPVGEIMQWLSSRDTDGTAGFSKSLRISKIFGNVVRLGFISSTTGADSVISALDNTKTIPGKKVFTHILKVYSGEDVLEKYCLCSGIFWENVLTVFWDIAEKLENAWKKYLKVLDDEMQKDDEVLIKQSEEAQEIKCFLETISL